MEQPRVEEPTSQNEACDAGGTDAVAEPAAAAVWQRPVPQLQLIAVSKFTSGRQDIASCGRQKELGDFFVTYELNRDTPAALEELCAELHGDILDVFDEYGRTDHAAGMRGRPHQRKILPKERWYTAPANAPQPAHPAASAGS